MSGTLLVVHDDHSSLRQLVGAFEDDHYSVRVAHSGADALGEASLIDIDVVILDLDVSDLDGLEVCRHLRQRTQLPIIALSSETTERLKVAALDTGADDYLTKPISVPELLARIRVAIRHRRALATIADDELLEVGMLRIDLASHEARIIDQPLDLTAKEFALLTVLARNEGKVVPHWMLIDRVWGTETTIQTLRTQMSQLRRKVSEVGSSINLSAEPGVGYRLDVSFASAV